MLRSVSALVAIFTLYSLRAWVVLAAAFFGVVLWRGAYAVARDGEWFEASFFGVMGGYLLVMSYRWFALRWTGNPSSDALSDRGER